MGLRTIIAERISPLRKRLKLDTPIIDEIVASAEIISSETLEFTPESLGLGLVPVIARGKTYGEAAGVWYRVTFPKSLNNPSIVAVAEGRIGAIPGVAAPKITIANVEVATALAAPVKTIAVQSTVPVASAAVQTSVPVDIPTTVIPYLNESFPYLTSDYAWVRDQICTPVNKIVESLYTLQTRLNDIIEFVNDGFAKTKKGFENTNVSISDLRTKVNTAVGDLRTNVNKSIDDLRTKTQTSINEGLKTLRDNAQAAQDTARDNVQKALNNTIVNTQDSVNRGLAALIPSLYAAWGLPSSMVITPIHVRNVTSTGFEFQSYGKTTCYYIAVGSLA